jgi:hypothetical protein
VWKASSAVVYRTIGRKKSLLTSPPLQSGSLGKKLYPAHLGYFNLHGIKEAAEWYGQKTADSSPKWPEYPIALSPTDFDEKNAPKVIFSEACYGTYIDCKSIDQAMSLNLLSKGSLAIVGSTVVSYGSVTSPLIGADLLGYFFWNYLRQGQSVGNAFLRAKFSLAREMSKRQGFLDGEDQKTLLSFVLYGDPLVTMEGAKSTPKSVFRSSIHPTIKTFSDKHEQAFVPETVLAEALVQVKHIVDQYLPELKEADIGISQQLCNCTHVNHQCAECKITSKTVKYQGKRIVVTLSKQVQTSNRVHPLFARFTIDDHGKLLKLSASR